MMEFLMRYFWVIWLGAGYIYMWVDAIKKAVKKGDSNYLRGMTVFTSALLFFASIIYFFWTN